MKTNNTNTTVANLIERNLAELEGFEHFDDYTVGTDGVVYSYKFGKRKALSPDCSNGYQKITLCAKKHRRKMFVHRLVALAFIDNVDNKPQVNHIDEDPMNNTLENLEWVTPLENLEHGTRLDRVSASLSKGVTQLTKDGKFVAHYPSQKLASEITGVYQSGISVGCRDNTKSAGGFKWMFTEDFSAKLKRDIEDAINLAFSNLGI